MKYIDSGNRSPADALGTWLQSQLPRSIVELRWQSGFFTADGLQPLVPMLQHLAATNLPTHGVVGSNELDTLESDVGALVALLRMPRSQAKLGIVSYSGAYYHPKTYHLRRSDGSQAAYVGSANLTLAGVSALHVEAGVVLDTADGDSCNVLDEIANAVDAWFGGTRAGVNLVENIGDVAALANAGVLSVARPPRPTPVAGIGSASGRPARPRLQPLVRFASPVPTSAGAATTVPAPNQHSMGTGTATQRQAASISSVPQNPPFPAYVLFAPGAKTPTYGPTALSGATLPGGAAGIIVRLNKDSARHWLGGPGTSNISIPVPTIQTLRFGMYQGRYKRPRAEYAIQMRYVSDASSYEATTVDTNVMVYGFAPGESGHGDVRLVVPKPPAREIENYATRNGLPLPAVGDVALLEWPTPLRPEIRLTLLSSNIQLFFAASELLATAANANQLVGQGACWLPVGFAPSW